MKLRIVFTQMRTAIGNAIGDAIGRACQVLALMALTSCETMLPPARNAGAVVSQEGVVLAITGQTCSQTPDANQPSQTTMDATFAIEAGTSTVDPLTVHLAGFLLVVSDRSVAPTSIPDAPESILVETGTTSRFMLHFVLHSVVGPGVLCSQEMRLVPNSALGIRGHRIEIDGIRFTPR